MYSTIQVTKKQKSSLDAFKDYPKETYSEVIDKLISIAKEEEEDSLKLSNGFLKGILEAEEDIKKGRIYSSKQIKKEFGF